MIELPSHASPNLATPTLIDFGGVLRPSTGAKLLRVNRAGSRFRVAMTLPVQSAEDARIIVARLIAAKTEGLRVTYPLQGIDQGAPGAPVVFGAGQSGNTIDLRGLTPGYLAREGFWLSIVRDGQHYLHVVRAPGAIANNDGEIALPISPNLRVPFPDDAVVHLGRPMIEGLIEGDVSWDLALAGLVDGIGFVIEEAE